jgi:O-6-methylguanine DNA methyltransferase
VERLYYDLFPTPFGWVALLASERGLRRLSLRPSPGEALESLGSQVAGAMEGGPLLREVSPRLMAYLRGEAASLERVPLDIGGAPPFFRAAWEACRSIPLGETRSYAWLASRAGRPGAAGQAMARNPIPIVIPCHRVIGSDGGLHGYGGGLEVKARLLELERRLRAGVRGASQG